MKENRLAPATHEMTANQTEVPILKGIDNRYRKMWYECQ